MFELFYGYDLAIARAMNALCEGAGAFFTPFFKFITQFGNVGWGFLVAAAIMLLFQRTRRAGVAALLAVALGAVFTNLILKNAVARPRPYADESSPFYAFWQAAGSMKESEFSFPSGHATASAAFAAALVCAFNKKTSWLYLFLPLVMGVTRVYFQVHFASDVLFGLLIGGACGVGAWFLTGLLAKWKLFSRFLQADGVVGWIKKRKKKAPSEEPAEDGEENEK